MRKRAREARAKAKKKAAGEYPATKSKSKGKYAYEFRFPAKYHEKITLVDYKSFMGEVIRRSVTAALAVGRDGGSLAENETSLGTGRWIEFGDRSQDFSKIDPWNRFGHSKFLHLS